MRKKFLSSCMIALLGFGMTSCSSDNTVAENDQSSVGHYSLEGTSYISVSTDGGVQSRSVLVDDKNYLDFQWKAGDQLIVVEPHVGVIGTLTTAAGSDPSTSGGSVSATFSGQVKGTLSEGDKLRFYHLGNMSVETLKKSLTCDFTIQQGTLESAAAQRYLASGEITMTDDASGNFVPSASTPLNLAAIVTVLKFNITYTDDASNTYNAKSCVINGLTNTQTINLLDGTFTTGYATNVYDESEEIKTIQMSHTTAQASPYYYVAVPVAEDNTVFSNPNMTCTFFGESSLKEMQSWTSWTIGKGKWYADTGGEGMIVTFSNDYSTKGGYGGCDILGGTNNTDYSTKGGYSGYNVDGQVDDPIVTKDGYTGTTVQ